MSHTDYLKKEFDVKFDPFDPKRVVRENIIDNDVAYIYCIIYLLKMNVKE